MVSGMYLCSASNSLTTNALDGDDDMTE